GKLPVAPKDDLEPRRLQKPNGQSQRADQQFTHRPTAIDSDEKALEAESELDGQNAARALADLVHGPGDSRGLEAASADPFEIARHLAVNLRLDEPCRPANLDGRRQCRDVGDEKLLGNRCVERSIDVPDVAT